MSTDLQQISNESSEKLLPEILIPIPLQSESETCVETSSSVAHLDTITESPIIRANNSFESTKDLPLPFYLNTEIKPCESDAISVICIGSEKKPQNTCFQFFNKMLTIIKNIFNKK